MKNSYTGLPLVERDHLHRLMKRSDLRGALQIGSHGAALLASGATLWTTWGSLWSVPLFALHGVLLNFLYAGQHELSHGTVFADRRANELCGRLIGFLMIFPRDFDRLQHAAHHRHTQDWAKDGELVREPYTLRSYLLWLSGITYWQGRVARIVRFCRGEVLEPYIRPADHATVIREGRVHAALYAGIAVASLAAQSWAAVVLWLAPMLLMKPVHQLQNTIEHLGLSHSREILDNTRSTRTNALMRWLCWQMPYHTAHHAYPGVPFWRLAELDRTMRESGAEPHAMGWIEFQIEVLKKLRRCSEADYPHDEVWIVPRARGGVCRLEDA